MATFKKRQTEKQIKHHHKESGRKENNLLNAEIGVHYVTLHDADCEEEFSKMVTAVLAGKKKISDYQRQIQSIKRIQYCEKCGAEVVKGEGYCSSCGASIATKMETISENWVRCKNCGNLERSDLLFCTSCGKPMSQSLTQTPVEIPNNAMKICPACGAETPEGSAFCIECGEKNREVSL